MAENTEKKTVKKVFIRKPEGTNAKAHPVCLNGKMYTVPYNKEVEVPLAVAEIIERSQKFQELAEKEQERISAEAGNVSK